MILTVGVPTYNRLEEISKFIDRWKSMDKLDDVELLISDNCSKEFNLNDLYTKIQEQNNIRVVQTKSNVGMTGNIYNIFLHAKGNFVLLTSDEDRLISGKNINKLIKHIRETDGLYYSTPFMRSNMGSPYKYTGINKSRPIFIGEFHSSNFYLSGGVYKKIETKKILERINNIKDKYLCAHLYPHSLVTAEFLLLEKKCYWIDIPVIEEGINLQPISTMPDSRRYNHFTSRYEQFLSFINYFNSLDNEIYYKNNVEKIIKCHEMNFILWLRWGLATTNLKLLSQFDKSLIRAAIILIQHRIKSLLSYKNRNINRITNETTRATWILTKYGKKK